MTAQQLHLFAKAWIVARYQDMKNLPRLPNPNPAFNWSIR